MDGREGAAAEWKRYWHVPVAAGLGYSTAVLHTYGLGPFIEPVQEEFGWSRARISAGLTIAGLVGAVMSVPMGMIVDRFGPRIIGLVGVVLMTASIGLLGTATGSLTNWILLWCFVAFANLWLQGTVWTKAVASRFDVSRGLAFAITLSGAPVTATLLPIIATSLTAAFDWRIAIASVAGIWLAVVFPVMFVFFRSAHEEERMLDPAERTPVIASGATFGEAIRSGAFYKLLLACGLFAFTVIGIVVHFVPILTDQGADRLGAAGIAALVGIFSLIGRLGTGFLLDRLPGHVVGAIIFLFPVISCGLLLLDGADPVSQAISASLFGLTVGAEVDVIAYLTSRHFGLRSYGVIFGAMMGALAIGTALGPLAAGAAYDMYQGYSEFLLLTIAGMLASSLALATLGTRPARIRPAG